MDKDKELEEAGEFVKEVLDFIEKHAKKDEPEKAQEKKGETA